MRIGGSIVKAPGSDRGVVFQHPSLFPWQSVLSNVVIGPKCQGVSRSDYEPRALSLLDEVGLSGFERHYPYQLSGGMQQRVQIAKALANNPSLVLLDELTTGLDISVQAGVLDLVRDIQRRQGLSAIVVSHDLSVIRLLADRTLVMKTGRVVEEGVTDQVLEDPQHPYTQLLVSSAA